MKLQKLKVEAFPDAQLCEIYQIVGLRFAFVQKTAAGFKQCHPFAKCRDFLHDAVRCTITNTNMSLYSFKFGPSNPQVDLKLMRMLVIGDTTTKAADWDDMMEHSLKLLHHYEAMVGKSKSTLVKIADPLVKSPRWLFIGPAFWMKTPYLVSMYTFLIRLGHKRIKFEDNDSLVKQLDAISKSPSVTNDNDLKYLKSCWNKLDFVIKNRKTLFGTKFDPFYSKPGISIGRFHDASGIVSLCKGMTANTELNTKFIQLCKDNKLAITR